MQLIGFLLTLNVQSDTIDKRYNKNKHVNISIYWMMNNDREMFVIFVGRYNNMKKTYIEPMMIVEDFEINDSIAAENCKYTPTNIGLVQQMTGDPKYKACAEGDDGDFPLDYSEFSNLYESQYDVNGNQSLNYDDGCFTADYNSRNPGNCLIDPFKVEGLTFGYDNAGSGAVCRQYDAGSGGDTSLLQNS